MKSVTQWALMSLGAMATFVPNVSKTMGGWTIYQAKTRPNVKDTIKNAKYIDGRFWVDGETNVSAENDKYYFW